MKPTFPQVFQLVALIGAVVLYVLRMPVEATGLLGVAVGQHFTQPFPMKRSTSPNPTPTSERVDRRSSPEDISSWFIVVLLALGSAVTLPACAHRQHMRRVDRVLRDCRHDAATVPADQLDAAEDECMRRLEALR